MADTPHTQTEGSNTGIAFIVGALVALVAIIGYFVLAEPNRGSDDVTIRVENTGAAAERAADAVGDAATGAADAVGDAAAGAADAVEDAVEN